MKLLSLVKRTGAFAAVVPASLFLGVITPTIPDASLPPAHLPVHYQDLAAPAPAALPAHSIVLTVESGDTLDSILLDGGFDRTESARLTREVARVADLRRLRPGNLVRFHYQSDGSIDSVQLKITGWGEVDAVRDDSGFLVVPQQASQHEIDTAISGRIESSLYDALTASGEGPQLVQQLADVFQWDIDFFALQRGDSFSLVVRKKFAGSDPIGYGPIRAARFTHSGQTFEAFWQEAPDGHGGYYGRNGSPLRKQFLKAPLQFTRITSKFSKSRWHPILHCFRPHNGVDYGAPVGTPVMSTADGVVVEVGKKRGEGNYIRIRHTERIDTYYLHLWRFGKGIRRGAKVMQGQVIGFVGSTGLTTGPHLDYRVSDHGKWLDPLKLKSITPDPLPVALAQQFRRDVVSLAPKLAVTPPQVAEFASRRRALF